MAEPLSERVLSQIDTARIRTRFHSSLSKKVWQERDYATIIAAARKIPQVGLQEDPTLLTWIDRALMRSGEES